MVMHMDRSAKKSDARGGKSAKSRSSESRVTVAVAANGEKGRGEIDNSATTVIMVGSETVID